MDLTLDCLEEDNSPRGESKLFGEFVSIQQNHLPRAE